MYACQTCHFKNEYIKGILKFILLTHREKFRTRDSNIIIKMKDLHHHGVCYLCIMCGNIDLLCQLYNNMSRYRRENKLTSKIQQGEDIIKFSNVLTFLSGNAQYNNVNAKKEGSLDNRGYHSKGPDVQEDVEMYTCEKCHFKTKYKENLETHFLTNGENFNEQMYTCETCKFRTKHKSSLKRHILLHTANSHRENSEVEMYACQTCHFKTKHKGNLKVHFFDS
ncbi:hypothetical protein NQ317_004148 [Molorchus minor]|uniref:C2H2-type domain-containing protein n=1 Tax=Molorchus minor TaxID=1323400 RepID=A0ABQ9J676_9CUCU|nr:hypothetical protein NQ317_004148 [Molorchus minor]